jgi:hypothetical protein
VENTPETGVGNKFFAVRLICPAPILLTVTVLLILDVGTGSQDLWMIGSLEGVVKQAPFRFRASPWQKQKGRPMMVARKWFS